MYKFLVNSVFFFKERISTIKQRVTVGGGGRGGVVDQIAKMSPMTVNDDNIDIKRDTQPGHSSST